MRTIRVTGKGRLKLKPDTARITLSLEGTYPEYDEALRKSSEASEDVKSLLSGFGFERSSLKTLKFSVDTEYESYMKNSSYKKRFIGYKFSHIMKLEFGLDNELMGKLMYALAHCEAKPEFRLSYTVKDTEAAKNELLSKAVKDAKNKAFALTEAAAVALKNIQSIDYSWGEINLEVEPFKQIFYGNKFIGNQVNGASYDMDIEPEDIEAEDTVTLIWEIE